MNNEDLKQEHDEATREKSAAEIAAGMEFEQISADLPKKVLDELARQNGITADALNISPSKFNKLNKEQLCEAIKAGKPESEAVEKKEAAAFDVLGFAAALFTTSREASAKNDFKKVDSLIMQTVSERLSVDSRTAGLATNNNLVTNCLYGGALCYTAARLVGFDVIAEKTKAIKSKLFGGVSVEIPKK